LRVRRRWSTVGEAARVSVQGQSWPQVTRVFESTLMKAAGIYPVPAPVPAASPLLPFPISA